MRHEAIKAGEEETLEHNDKVFDEVLQGREGLEAKGVYKVSKQ